MSNDITVLKKRLAVVEEMRLCLIKAIAAAEQSLTEVAQADRLWQCFRRMDSADNSSNSPGQEPLIFLSHHGKDIRKVKTIMDAIRDAIGTFNSEFSSKEVEEFIKMRYPRIHSKLSRVTVPNALYKMRAKYHLISQVEKGKNGQPSRFVKGSRESNGTSSQRFATPTTER